MMLLRPVHPSSSSLHEKIWAHFAWRISSVYFILSLYIRTHHLHLIADWG